VPQVRPRSLRANLGTRSAAAGVFAKNYLCELKSRIQSHKFAKMKSRWLFPLTPFLVLCAHVLLAQTPASPAEPSCSGFFSCWQARATATQNAQPHWATPLATVTPRLEQEFRTDFVRQTEVSNGTEPWTYDNGKGLELIPLRNVELLINVPPYVQHNSTAQDGFGDVSFTAKYRIFARNEQHGNEIVTFFLGGTYPTGSYDNGAANATVTPTLAAGKGFGMFDVQSTLGGTIPVEGNQTAGMPVAWNTTFQAHMGRFFWPEVEDNYTRYFAGDHDGMTQNFITPGFVAGRIPLAPHTLPRLGLTLGAGIQTRTSSFSTTNHNLVFTARAPF